MAWYRCYIKSVGGGIECENPIEFKSEEDAMYYAREIAIEDYEMFEGYHGIPNMEDIFDNWEEYGLEEYPSQDAAWECYQETRENWIDYWVEEASGPDDIDEDYQ